MADGELYSLDTNILVHYVRGDSVWSRVRDDYDLLVREPKPVISIVVTEELRSLAIQNNWGVPKLDQMEFCLGYFDVIYIDSLAIVLAYAAIDAHFQKLGHTLGKNDLWIAATTHVLGAKLLTTDRDFDRMDPLFLHRDWIDPSP